MTTAVGGGLFGDSIMSEVTREELINYCDKHELKYHGNAGINTLQDIVAEHKALQADTGDDLQDSETESEPTAEGSEPTTEASEPTTEDNEPTNPPPPPEPKPKKSDGSKFKNVGKSKHSVAGKVLAPGEKVTLTKAQLQDERLMAKIETAVRCGNLKAV